ncbi:MAG TPA: succinylglutamate-semialdehyde dehydrogenase [Tepidisphaeraceae bacterium]|jgi:succinylglutamic semialdehyde dehydrogenase|nr:succinylglutamate-semialdehyde dehydrogenase [Tepidisphaeraceae bacterium]
MSTSRRAFLTGHWISGQGDWFHSTDPSTGTPVWEGRAATEHDVKAAIAAARAALPAWTETPLENRIALLNRFADELRARKTEMATEICAETGKPTWEALSEVDAMIAKVAISIAAHAERRKPTERQQAGATAATRYKPMGVMAVFGPFNMPGHLPNGHIVPALLAGNTIVFKPSELTPGVGEKLAEMFHHAGIPPGIVNLLQGGRDVGELLAQHPGIDGILFTGSATAGLAIKRATLEQPWKILALEMGGNNPLVVWEPKDLAAAAYLTIQSAFITSGQRCSCARRLIVPDNAHGSAFVERLIAMMRTIRVGPCTQTPEPFMGPVISDAAAEKLFAAQAELIAAGGVPLVELTVAGERRAMLAPAIIDVTPIPTRPDAEFFGPLLQLIRVPDFDAALAESNHTAFGLAAGLFSDNADLWKRFHIQIRAGVIYWNRQTTGGSSHLPFGGVGSSGNFRPSGYWAADYCSYPVASMGNASLTMPSQRMPGIG